MPNIFKIGEGVQEALNFELVGSLKRLGALPTSIQSKQGTKFVITRNSNNKCPQSYKCNKNDYDCYVSSVTSNCS